MSRELEFERPVRELERKIEALRRIAQGGPDPLDARPTLGAPPPHEGPRDTPGRFVPASLDSGPETPATILAGLADDAARGSLAHEAAIRSLADESTLEDVGSLELQIERLEQRARELQAQVFSSLTRWQVVQLSRHPMRPYTLDYIARIFPDFVELHGDRAFADDGALVGGVARFQGRSVLVIGHQKGRTTKENVRRNFGMARPEGYRKHMRLMRFAERFRLPVITLIDTPGAYPGIDAEERGQAQAIAESLELMASLTVPIIAVVIGEGGSGGALAIGVANRVLMLEFSTYSVISPEACSSILFKDASHAERAADALRLTAPDLQHLKVIDGIVPEPLGGAHRDHDGAAVNLSAALEAHLGELSALDPEALRSDRYARFRAIGALDDQQQEAIHTLARSPSGAPTGSPGVTPEAARSVGKGAP